MIDSILFLITWRNSTLFTLSSPALSQDQGHYVTIYQMNAPDGYTCLGNVAAKVIPAWYYNMYRYNEWNTTTIWFSSFDFNWNCMPVVWGTIGWLLLPALFTRAITAFRTLYPIIQNLFNQWVVHFFLYHSNSGHLNLLSISHSIW